MLFDDVFGLWLDGERRFRQSDPADQPAIERAVEVIVDELRRRLSAPFTTDELAALYGSQNTDWAFELATHVAPSNPAAWDMPTVAGAAFARYAREASDYRTRQTVGEEE
ncbi:MAG: hypothetical protein QOJ25_970 [Solirubrobacteraceae bacterium]|jgi:hypothetical protein|nr:hypothetical protein [Solirubrobacteraceae bacterium]